MNLQTNGVVVLGTAAAIHTEIGIGDLGGVTPSPDPPEEEDDEDDEDIPPRPPVDPPPGN